MSDKQERKFSLHIILILIFIVLTTILFQVLDNRRNEYQEKHLQLITERYTAAYGIIYEQNKQLATAIYSGIMERFAVQQVYQKLLTADAEEKDRLRKKLWTAILPRYQKLQQESGVKLLIHFHSADNISFLRIHRPQSYGDDLTGLRTTVETANKNHSRVDGFEEGKMGSGYRFVFPITAPDNSHLGSMEISFGPEALTSAMMRQYAVLSNFYIKENVLPQTLFPEERTEVYRPSHHQGYLFDNRVLAQLQKTAHKGMQKLKPGKEIIDLIYEKAHSGQPASVYDPILDIVITTIPIFHTNSDEMHAFFTVRSSSDFFENEKRQFWVVFSQSLLLLFMVLGTFYLQQSKRTQLEFKTKELDQQRRQLVEAQTIANLGHWEFDHLSNELHWSDQVCTIFGLKADEFTGTVDEFLKRVHGDDLELVTSSFLESVQNRHPYDLQHRIVTPAGKEKWVRERGSTSYDKSWNPLSTLGITHDITAQKKAEERLSLAKQDAEVANRAKSVFLSTMSHELRTPLNAILGYSQILSEDHSLTARRQQDVKIMRQAGEHLLMLINDILDLSKIEAGKTELRLAQLKLPQFLQGVVDLIKVRADAKGLEFSYRCEGEIPLVVEADELRLRQVLLNMLSNAVNFTATGHCSLSVRVKPVNEQCVLLTLLVEDSGQGIAPEMLEEVFNPFQQAGELLHHSEGSGLGLAISSKLVLLMGGELQLLSPINEHPQGSEGPGSRFFFSLELPVLDHGVDAVMEQVTQVKVPEILCPPAEELDELLALVGNGDIAGISKKTAALAVVDYGRYGEFAARVKELTDDFQVSRIKQFIDSQRKRA